MKARLTICVLAFIIICIPITANALTYIDVTETLGLTDTDLEAAVIKIIQWALGLVGLISVIMVLYGGFSWLTSMGNEEKITKAKKIITAAITGVVVIMMSWAILDYAKDVIAGAVT